MGTQLELWDQRDESLFALMIQTPANQFHTRLSSEERRIRFEVHKRGNSAGLGPGLLDMHIEVMRDWAAAYDRIAREVWEINGKTVTPHFLRTVLPRITFQLLDVRHSTVKFKFMQARTGISAAQIGGVLGSLARRVGQLKAELARNYEIEARKLIARSGQSGPVPRPAVVSVAAPSPPTVAPLPVTVPLADAAVAPLPEVEGSVKIPSIFEIRAGTVAKVIKELDGLKGVIYGEEDYQSVRVRFPEYVTFQVAEAAPALKRKLIHLNEHKSHILLAQEIAATHHSKSVDTIKTDWKKFKPTGYRRK
jgi:hypothetical protein